MSVFELPPSAARTNRVTRAPVADEERLGQLARHRVFLADQRVCEQRPAARDGRVVDGRGDGHPLVRSDVLHEPSRSAGSGSCGAARTVGADPRRQLDDVVVGETGQRAVVAHVDHLHRPVAGASEDTSCVAASL